MVTKLGCRTQRPVGFKTGQPEMDEGPKTRSSIPPSLCSRALKLCSDPFLFFCFPVPSFRPFFGQLSGALLQICELYNRAREESTQSSLRHWKAGRRKQVFVSSQEVRKNQRVSTANGDVVIVFSIFFRFGWLGGQESGEAGEKATAATVFAINGPT